MIKYFGGIRFTKTQSKINEAWYDWLSDQVPIRYLNNKPVRIRLEGNDDELDHFHNEIDSTVANVLQISDSDREQAKEHLFAYYKDVLLTVGEDDIEGMPILDSSEEIWSYINLNRLVIAKGIMSDDFYANFSGSCQWEDEHGIAVSYLWGKKLAMVSMSIGHVCNSDAYAEKGKDHYIYIGSNIKTESK